jgi:hypothetical protein
LSRRAWLQAVLYLASAGLALHLILPQLPGIRRSLALVAGSSGPLLVAAFGAILASFLCYGELLGRSAGAAAGFGASIKRRRRRGLGRFFTLRLTVVVHGAYRVLPGGGGATAAVTYAALRGRGLSPAKVGLAVAAAGALTYAVLGAWLLTSLLYLILDRELNRLATLGALVLFALTIAAFLAALVAQRRPAAVQRALSGLLYGVGRPFLRRRWSRKRTEDWAERVVFWLRDEAKVFGDQLLGSPSRALKLGVLAFGYWAFDALCLIVVFWPSASSSASPGSSWPTGWRPPSATCRSRQEASAPSRPPCWAPSRSWATAPTRHRRARLPPLQLLAAHPPGRAPLPHPPLRRPGKKAGA